MNLNKTVEICFLLGMPNNFQQNYQFGNPGMYNMGMPPQLNQENLLRIVQEMKQKVNYNIKVKYYCRRVDGSDN